MTRRLPCPGCSQGIPVPPGTGRGALIQCGNCAGVLLRLVREGGQDALRVVQLVSCPACGERIPVDEDTRDGMVIRHRGVPFRLTRAFGAFALELEDGESPRCGPPARGRPGSSSSFPEHAGPADELRDGSAEATRRL